MTCCACAGCGAAWCCGIPVVGEGCWWLAIVLSWRMVPADAAMSMRYMAAMRDKQRADDEG